MTGQALTETTPIGLPQVIGASRQLSIASTLGDEIVRKRWIAFLTRRESEVGLAIISKWQPLDEESIELFKDSLNWGLLSENEALLWTQDLIDRFLDRWDWGDNSFDYYFNTHSFSLETIQDIPDYLGEGLSGNAMLPWSSDFIEKFKSHLGFRIVADNQRASSALTSMMPAIFSEAMPSLWDFISSRSLPWSVDLIERCKEQLDWESTPYVGYVNGDPANVDVLDTSGSFSLNETIPWSLGLIDQFKDRWDWVGLLCNRAVPWPVESIESLGSALLNAGGNNRVPTDFWPDGLIKQLVEFTPADSDDSEEIDFGFGDCVVESLDGGLVPNPVVDDFDSIDLESEGSIEGQSGHTSRDEGDEIGRQAISFEHQRMLDLQAKVRNGISRNLAIEWSSELIDRNVALWDWSSLSANVALPWLPVLIEHHEDRWDWKALSFNVGLPWSFDLIGRYENRWDWEALSSNTSLPWSFDLIERYENRWDWKALSSNTGLPWSLDLIRRYKDRWHWKTLSSSARLPWSKELVALYEDRWDWAELSRNEALPWSIDLIERFESRLDYHSLTELSGVSLAMPGLKLSELDEVFGHFGFSKKPDVFLEDDK